MTQISAKDLDYSPEMKSYFHEVFRALVEKHKKSAEEALDLINIYFSIEIAPLERALVMHCDPGEVAEDLAGLPTP